MDTNKKRIAAIGAGLLAVAVLAGAIAGIRRRTEKAQPEPSATEATAMAPSVQNEGSPVPPAEEPIAAPVPRDIEAPAQPSNADERAQAVLGAGLGNSEGKPPAGDSTALNRFMATHDLEEKDLLGKLSRAGETTPEGLEGLFALRRRGASEAEMKAYARSNVRGIASRAIVFKWIDKQLGKPPVRLPPPGNRKAMDLGTVEYKGPPR